MTLPYTLEVYLAFLTRYEDTLWPLQTLFLAVSLLIFFLSFLNRLPRFVLAILAIIWALSGIIFYALNFSDISFLSSYVAVLFYFQAAIITIYGVFIKKLQTTVMQVYSVVSGGTFALLAFIVMPVTISIYTNQISFPVAGLYPHATALLTLSIVSFLHIGLRHKAIISFIPAFFLLVNIYTFWQWGAPL
jgi:hypothetical protein